MLPRDFPSYETLRLYANRASPMRLDSLASLIARGFLDPRESRLLALCLTLSSLIARRDLAPIESHISWSL